METTIIETVLVTAQTGKTTVFDVIQNLCPNTWTRAYARETSLYYDMETFERGLSSGKPVRIERIGLFDLPFVTETDERGVLLD